MRGRSAIVLAGAFAAILGATGLAAACPALPDGLRASARPINVGSPIAANGAIVLHLDCWHDCTACQAASQVVEVDLRDDSGRLVLGTKPEQVFLSDKPLEHLVIWRPREPLAVGAHYTVQVGVAGQSDTNTTDVEVKPAEATTSIAQHFTARSTSYREERGTIFHCDASRTDCDRTELSFGNEYALLPALSIALDAATAGQLLFRVRDTTLGGTANWSSWFSGGESPSTALQYREHHDAYCADVEARSLVGSASSVVFPICASHGDLDAPSMHTTDADAIDSELKACPRPPAELQDRWCALKILPCGGAGSCCLNGCADGQDYCGPNPRKGDGATIWVDHPPAAPQPDPPCANPGDPYALVAGGGCQIGHGAENGRGALVALIGFLACARRRREHGF